MLAIIFDSVGAGEWLVLLAVLLVVMGPKRLPATARKVGSYYSKFRRAADSFKRQLMDMDYEMERELKKVEDEAKAATADITDDGSSDPYERYAEHMEDESPYGDGDPGEDEEDDDAIGGEEDDSESEGETPGGEGESAPKAAEAPAEDSAAKVGVKAAEAPVETNVNQSDQES